MTQPIATLRDFSGALETLPTDAPVVFSTETGEIGAGYHVTELKIADIRGIDCGGRQDAWQEAALQLLDGRGRAHMAVGKLRGILAKSYAALPGLQDAPVHVEFAHGNAGLQRHELGAPGLSDGRVIVPLSSGAAQCKPMVDAIRAHKPAAAGCCA